MRGTVATLGLLFALGSPAVTLGQVTVYADIEGVGKSGTNNYVDISGSYVNGCMTYTIAPVTTTGASPNNLARVEATEGDPEQIWLRNVKITATSDCVDYGHIFFYAVFNGPPDTTVNPAKKVSIERSANGAFVPAVFGSWVTATGWAQHNPADPLPPDGFSGSWEEIRQSDSHTVTCGTCGAFNNLKRTKTWDPDQQQSFTGQRVLKGELWFKLENNGNKLQFTNDAAKGLKIRSVPEQGGGTAEPR